VANYQAGLTVLERLDAAGQLPPPQKQWIDKVRQTLEAARE
jgi:hypothetical protein